MGHREAHALMAVGASEVIQPEIESAHTLIRHALRSLSIPKDQTLAFLQECRTQSGAEKRENSRPRKEGAVEGEMNCDVSPGSASVEASRDQAVVTWKRLKRRRKEIGWGTRIRTLVVRSRV